MGRVIIVSNRVSTIATADANPGGLAIAMRAALDREQAIWFGWSGDTIDATPGPPRVIQDRGVTRMVVDLTRDDYRRYYAGFANRALWPLFHYRIDLVEFEREDYDGYRRVNEEFARHLIAVIEDEDLVWVHDYHLIPLGAALRRHGVTNRIGFFLHTPFPCPEVLRTLPMHEDLIRALCAYDVVGFQTDRDLFSYTDYVKRESSGEADDDGNVSAFGRSLRTGAFPISIDQEAVARRSARAANLPQCTRLKESLAGRSLMIGVDRLDYTKGLLQRFEAIELLLESHADYRRRIVALQIAPASRSDVPEYRKIRSALDRRIGHINGRFGEPDLLPVRYLNKKLGQETLFGFFRMSDIGVVTPLRDGMNLVAKEFVASQTADAPGVLVLSCFAGAARELDAAIIVNPYDIVAVAAALDRALSMPLEERRERNQALLEVIRRWDVHSWRNAFLEALSKPRSDGWGTRHGTRVLAHAGCT